jgi:hypothetical protein
MEEKERKRERHGLGCAWMNSDSNLNSSN